MANYYPATYQPYYQQYPQQQQQMNSGIIWVQGEAGAKSYLVAPNTTVQLWDSEAQTIYLKSADASGMPSIKVIDYTIRESRNSPTSNFSQQGDYVTKQELEALRSEIKRLKERIEKGEEITDG